MLDSDLETESKNCNEGKTTPLLSNTSENNIGKHEGRKEIFYLTTHSTHFIYGYMASDIW